MGEILNDGTKRVQYDEALMLNIRICTEIADMVKTTLGPHGLDKMMVDPTGNMLITNDGASILKALDTSQPASKLLVSISQTQDETCGDGTTTATIIAGGLLGECKELRVKWGIHPTLIAKGYVLAMRKALAHLRTLIVPCKTDEDLIEIARTSLNSKSAKNYENTLIMLAVNSIKAVYDGEKANVKDVKVIKRSGESFDETMMVTGVVIPNRLPAGFSRNHFEDVKIALITGGIEKQKEKIEAKDWKALEEIKKGMQNELSNMVGSLRTTGDRVHGNVVAFVDGNIDDSAMNEFISRGMMAFKLVSSDDMGLLQKATGATICSITNFNESKLGNANSVKEIVVGGEPLIFVENKNSKAVSIVIRGGAYQSIDEVDRAMHDCLMVVADAIEDKEMLPGGGSTMVDMAMSLREYAKQVGGKEQMAIESYANALESIPLALARNGGMEGLDILLQLRKAHLEGKSSFGVDYTKRGVDNMMESNVVEPFRVVEQALNSATEVANQIIRVDDMLVARPLAKDVPEMRTNSIGK